MIRRHSYPGAAPPNSIAVRLAGARSSRRRLRRLTVAVVAGLTAAVSLAAGLASVVAAQDDEQVTLTIGLDQDLDSPNVTAGELVSSFELWNLQYATLTDKAADDFATIEGLAESWEESNDGLTYTYTLREALQWSDGEPLAAEDVAYTINRSRDEEWLNHSATTANLEATAIDERTVEITSSVPDPELPTMDVYIVPKHIYEDLSAEDVTTYDALDGVGSGPFTLEDWSPGQSWTMVANPNYYGWGDDGPQIDRVVFRVFDNLDAMAAALEAGEIDAAHNLPAESFERLEGAEVIVAVQGEQGSFAELALNGQAGGIGDGHPALLDLDVRHAIAMAIDRQTLVDRVLLGLGTPGGTISPSADPTWQPEVPDDVAFGFDPDAANALLDEAGYADTDGDGIREMPDGSRDLTMRYAERSESDYEPELREFITGWLADIGIATEVSVYDDTQLTDVIASGEYDLFTWGRTPLVDPDPMLSNFTCDQVTYDVEEVGSNDANWCDAEYDAMYEGQKVELDPERRREIVHEMLLHFYTDGSYVVLFEDPDLQAYRTDRFEGWTHQPAEVGPVLFTKTSPSYVNLTPTGDGSSGGRNTALWIAVAAGAAALLAIGGVFAVRRRATREERD
jgi:peptide/nickel transport system substrate-binding protein